jgi:hypothetical protein
LYIIFPTARANDLGIKSFYIPVKTAYGKKLDDNLWIEFVWDTVYDLMCNNNDGETRQGNQNVESVETSNHSYIYDNNIEHHNIPMSQFENSYIRRSPTTSLSQYPNEPVDSSFSEYLKFSTISTPVTEIPLV